MVHVRPAINSGTVKQKRERMRLREQIRLMSEETQRPDSSTSFTTAKDVATTLPQTSSPSVTPSSDSKPHWRQPTTIMEFASQVNAVCNRVLNGTIDLEKAKLYSAMARVVTQAANIEVARGRMGKYTPDLDLNLMEDEAFGDESNATD
jgi:hypothetical protein